MKKLFAVLLTAVLFLVPLLSVSADYPSRVDDGAGLLTAEQITGLESAATEYSEKYNFDFVIVTTEDYGSAGDIRAFSEDYYDYGGYSADGLILAINMQDRSYILTTSGTGIGYFSQSDMDEIEDGFVSRLSDGDYYAAFSLFLDLSYEHLDKVYGTVENPEQPTDTYYNSNADSQEDEFTVVDGLLVSIVIGLVAGGITVLIMRSKMKTAKFQPAAGQYLVPGSFQLAHSSDTYLYTTETRTRINNDDNNGSGGGGVHIGSSGSSHTSSGGHF